MPGGARRGQEVPEVARRCKEVPGGSGGARMCQEVPGGSGVARMNKEVPGGARRRKEVPGGGQEGTGGEKRVQ